MWPRNGSLITRMSGRPGCPDLTINELKGGGPRPPPFLSHQPEMRILHDSADLIHSLRALKKYG
jgi:hypothetical protein